MSNIHILRLKPKEKLSAGILDYCKKNNIKYGVILSLLGSLSNIELGFLKKLPGEFIKKKFAGPLEIVCGTGTIAVKGSKRLIHIHLQISEEKKSIGGHLIEGEIFSTAEVVILETKEKIERYLDSFTGLNELKN